MSLEKTRTSLKLEWKPLMTIPSNTPWLNLSPSGILNWRLRPWCPSMKNSSNLQVKTSVASNLLESFTTVLTTWNPSLPNLWWSSPRTRTTTTKTMWRLKISNWPTSMVLTKTTLLVTSLMETWPQRVSSQRAQLSVRLRKNSRTISFIHRKMRLSTMSTLT